jgi:hypothetical protein
MDAHHTFTGFTQVAFPVATAFLSPRAGQSVTFRRIHGHAMLRLERVVMHEFLALEDDKVQASRWIPALQIGGEM